MAEYQREERVAYRENSGDLLKYSAEYSLAHAGEELPAARKEPPKRMSGNSVPAQVGLGIVPVPTRQTETARDS